VIRGDKSTEEVQSALRAAGREVVEVVVYQTSQRPELETALRTALPEIYPAQPNGLSSQLKPSTTPPAPWLAFFSPSSAGMVLDLLVGSAGIRVFAIGETTRKYLLSREVKVDAVANEPTAQGMLEALRRAEEVS
jgi:uroporphyrinogen-III synthase